MNKFLGILVLGLMWCSVSYAEEIVLSCEFNTLRNEHIYTDEYSRTYIYIIIPEVKIWKYADGTEGRLIIDDNYYVTYDIYPPSPEMANPYLTIRYTTINRYERGTFYASVTTIPDDDRFNEYKNKKYNYKTFLELKQYVLYLVRSKAKSFTQSAGTCKPAKEKL